MTVHVRGVGGKIRAGLILWGNLVFKEGVGIFPPPNFGGVSRAVKMPTALHFVGP